MKRPLSNVEVWYRRKGDIVQLSINNTGTSISSTEKILFTLPVGYRPPMAVQCAATGRSNNLGQVQIMTSGDVKLWLFNGSSTYFAANVVFFTDDPFPA